MKKIFIKSLNSKEKKAFYLFLIYSIIEGIILGVLALNEFVLIKGLQATNIQIALLVQFTVLVLIFSAVFNEFLKRIQNKKKLLYIVALVTRLPLLLLIFFPADISVISNKLIYQYIFLTIFFNYFLATPIILPIINLFLKQNIQHENFGKLYGYATTVSKIFLLIVTFGFGLLLDKYNTAFRFVYPILGLLGILSIIILTNIDFKEAIIPKVKKTIWKSIKESGINLIAIVKKNKPFRDFEIGFILYGFAWMATSAVITIFLDKILHLNYSSLAFYKNSYNIIAIFLMPFFSRLIGKIDPRRFGIYTFIFMALFLFFMGMTKYVTYNFEFLGIKFYYTLLASYFFYGLFTATMGLLWYIGSAYFCKPGEEANYQSIHLTLTGARGLVAPLLGISLFEIIGFTSVLSIGIGLLLFAIIIMFWSLKKQTKNFKL